MFSTLQSYANIVKSQAVLYDLNGTHILRFYFIM